MKPYKTFIVFLAVLGLITAGCAKPAVQKYPPVTVYDKPMGSLGTPPDVKAGEPTAAERHLAAAVYPLKEQATAYLLHGELEKAQSTTERAIRIDPNNAELWHLMAKIALADFNFDQAEQFARKSNLYAKKNNNLRAKNYRVMAEALRRKKMYEEAKKAMDKARLLESR